MAQAGDIDGANDALMNGIVPKLQEVINGLETIDSRYNELVSENVLSMEALGSRATVITVIVIVVAVAIALFLAFVISGKISKPLGLMAKALNQMGTKGDLALTPEMEKSAVECSTWSDEIGMCARAIGGLIEHLMDVEKDLERVADGELTVMVNTQSERDNIGMSVSALVDNLNRMFGEINASTAQVSTASKQIADGAQTLAQGSTEQASAVEQLSNAIAEIAQKTKHNAERADKTADLANTIMSNAEKGSRQMGEMMTAVKEINEASQNIGKVIKVIDDIAFQTNILALNAAVEAARAGQHGKGFAVVAEEVRNLAAKSAEAAKDTGSLIANSIKKAKLGARIADETAAASEEMSGQADMLHNLVAQFRLKGSDADGVQSSPSLVRSA